MASSDRAEPLYSVLKITYTAQGDEDKPHNVEGLALLDDGAAPLRVHINNLDLGQPAFAEIIQRAIGTQ